MSDFDSGLIKYFTDRLSIFLCIDLNEIPDVMFTNSEKKIIKQYAGEESGEYSGLTKTTRAFYDEIDNIIVFDARKYDKNHDHFFLDSEEVTDKIDSKYFKQYKYIIPISDIYHELTHFFQDKLVTEKYDDCRYTDIIEASDEIYTYFLTGQMIDYEKQALSLWYLSKYELKLKGMKFYMFIRGIIVNPRWEQDYILNNKDMIKMLAEQYDGKLENFIARLKIDMYYKELVDEFYKDIDEIHNLIFYKW